MKIYVLTQTTAAFNELAQSKIICATSKEEDAIVKLKSIRDVHYKENEEEIKKEIADDCLCCTFYDEKKYYQWVPDNAEDEYILQISTVEVEN